MDVVNKVIKKFLVFSLLEKILFPGTSREGDFISVFLLFYL